MSYNAFMAGDQHHLGNGLHQMDRTNLNQPSQFAEEVLHLPSKKMTLLDLGCGSGTATIFFAQYGIITVGTDFSEVVIARDKNTYHAPELSVQVLDTSKKMPFDENYFDCSYS